MRSRGGDDLAALLADLWCSAFFWPKVTDEAERVAPVWGRWERVKSDSRTKFAIRHLQRGA